MLPTASIALNGSIITTVRVRIIQNENASNTLVVTVRRGFENMMARKWQSTVFACLAVVALVGLFYIVARIRSVSLAVSIVEKCGGGVSEGFSYIEGPSFVTFNIPGLERPVRDSDADDLAIALSHFSTIQVIDLSDTEIGDDFIAMISKYVKCQEIRISRTRCTERAVLMLAQNRSCERIRAIGINISSEMSKQMIEMDVEVLK